MSASGQAPADRLADLAGACVELSSGGQWAQLCDRAETLRATARDARRLPEYLLALQLLAQARRKLGDLTGTIDAWEELLDAAPTKDHRLRAVASDNLGNVLTDSGLFDEALRRYADALELEDDPDGRSIIRMNRANAYVQLGELKTAAAQHLDLVADLEHRSTEPEKLAIALDNAALAVAELGEHDAAIDLLERANGLLGQGASLEARGKNAISRTNALAAVGDDDGSAAAFTEAYDLAFEWARGNVDVERYRHGFDAAWSARVDPQLWMPLFAEALAARDAGDPGGALARWSTVSKHARDSGDHALALRTDANAAALLADLGDVDQSSRILWQVVGEARKRGLAQPEAMAWGTLGALAGSGADLSLPLGPLGALAQSLVLIETHAAIVAERGLSGADAMWEALDTGSNDNNLGKQAAQRHAFQQARDHLRSAATKARELGDAFALANRLGNLVDVLDSMHADDEADEAAAELARVLERPDLPLRGRIAAHKVLGEHLAPHDRDAAIDHLRQARDLVDELRLTVPDVSRRSDVMAGFHHVYRLLARLLRERGDAAAAYEALQAVKGRRLADALAERSGTSDAPPTVAEIGELLEKADPNAPNVAVDLVVDGDGLDAYVISAGDVSVVSLRGDVSALEDSERGDVQERERRLVRLCLNDPLLNQMAASIEASLPTEARVLLVPDAFMHNLPLHVIPVDGIPWCERRQIGHLAATASLRLREHHTLTGRSLVAGDSSKSMPLPHAAKECELVAGLLGVTPLTGARCTRPAIEDALSQGVYDVVHLAVHGRGDPRHGGRASVLLGERDWVMFDELAALPWRAELVVFSGCSTAVSGLRHQRDFLGVAQAAVEAGAAAVIACLWPVGDQAASVFMQAFYEWFVPRRRSGPVDLREGLGTARATLRGWLESRSHGLERRRDARVGPEPTAPGAAESDLETVAIGDWGPFVVLGNPLLWR